MSLELADSLAACTTPRSEVGSLRRATENFKYDFSQYMPHASPELIFEKMRLSEVQCTALVLCRRERLQLVSGPIRRMREGFEHLFEWAVLAKAIIWTGRFWKEILAKADWPSSTEAAISGKTRVR